MRYSTTAKVGLMMTVLAAWAAAPAAAQQNNHILAGSVGVGGGVDGTLDDGFSDAAFQLMYGFYTEPKKLVTFRAGQFTATTAEGLLEADITYLNVGGEYRFFDDWYDSGVYAGLGIYDASSDADVLESDTSIGLVIGLTGEFGINRSLSVVVDVAAHWMDVDAVDIAATANAGIAWKF